MSQIDSRGTSRSELPEGFRRRSCRACLTVSSSCFQLGFIVWFPILFPDLSSTTFTNTAAALAFIGGTVFEIGSYLMVVEALDRGRELNFGTALGMLLHHRRRSHRSGRRHITGVTGHGDAADDDEAGGAGGAGGATGMEQRPSCDWSEGKEDSGDGVEWPSGAKGFLWWGKPLWHDLGYDAVSVTSHEL